MNKDFAFYEPAMRIPMVFRAPGRPGAINGDPVSGIDVFPTLCDLMGLPPAWKRSRRSRSDWHGIGPDTAP
jgi:arylsulfatase A-like enzyme